METTPQIEKHLTASMDLKKRNIVIANFLGGLAWGTGTVIGATVMVAIIGSILGAIGFFSGIHTQLPQIPQLYR